MLVGSRTQQHEGLTLTEAWARVIARVRDAVDMLGGVRRRLCKALMSFRRKMAPLSGWNGTVYRI